MRLEDISVINPVMEKKSIDNEELAAIVPMAAVSAISTIVQAATIIPLSLVKNGLTYF